MNLIFLPPGQRETYGSPGQHLGVSHTCKHYLDAKEQWEDLPEHVADPLRPRAVIQRLSTLEIDAVKEHWSHMMRVYRDGYCAEIGRRTRRMDPPGTSGGPWVVVPHADYQRAAHVGDGVVLRVRSAANGWQMHTAYRPNRFVLNDYDHVPTDSRSTTLRRKLACSFADQEIAVWRSQEKQ